MFIIGPSVKVLPAASSGVLRLPRLFDQMARNPRVPMTPSGPIIC